MWGFTPWQMLRGVFIDTFMRGPMLKLAELGYRLAMWL